MNISFLDEDFSALNHLVGTLHPTKIFILVDENTHEYCLPTLLGNLETHIPFEIIEIEAGEEQKNIQTTLQLWEILAEYGADRKALLLNLGGGIITDLGGFIASTYKRGIPFVHIPTTLLAMVDASIGGKTGIDHLFYKNMIGTFAQAEAVLLYPPFLNTLPQRELISGLAEMLKHGLITDAGHWQDLIGLGDYTPAQIAPFITRSAEIKAEIVANDFREEHLRKTLNFGHTIGHAVESLFLQAQSPVLHGEAVAMGMIAETYLAHIEGLLSQEDTEYIIQHLHQIFPVLDISHFSDEDIISIMLQDKKNQQGHIHFSLLKGIGQCNYDYRVSLENIVLALHFYRNLAQ